MLRNRGPSTDLLFLNIIIIKTFAITPSIPSDDYIKMNNGNWFDYKQDKIQYHESIFGK